ncbi:MAG TPA: glycosyltransferase family 2 protein [Acidimicrobiales bacterium]|nr:glycosyltransferase family 2 protein [Acidimicrobiales bacterium]
MTTTDPDLAVVIVNWNTVDLLDECLQSIVDFGPSDLRTEVIVVDNASTDGSVAHLREHWPSVRIIENAENVGFCRANNQAIEVTAAPYLLLVNTDARLTEGCADAMIGYLDRDPTAAVVGPRLVYGDGSFQRWTAGRSLTLISCANYYLGLDRLARRVPALAGIYLPYDTDESFTPGWVTSAVMLVRRAALDAIGLLDDSIFVYMDDVDLCQRAIDAGWHVWYAADATAVHFMGASTRRETGKVSPEAMRAFNRWYERRHGPRSARAVRALQTVGFGSRAGVHAIKGLLRRDDAARGAARAHWTRCKLSWETIDA